MAGFKISIIVPVYNLKEYLARCVESLLAQTYQNIEVILVDDGSGDGSGELCDGYAARDQRVKSVHKENGGLVSAWKKGLAESTGVYVSFVDGDDWVDAEMLEAMAAWAVGRGKEIISCDYLIERPEGAVAVYQTLKPGIYLREQMEKEVFSQLLGNENRTVCFSRCMKLITRSLIEENAHFSSSQIRMGEDVTVILPAIFDCDRLVIMDRKAYYHYFYNPMSMVHKYDRGLLPNIERLRGIIDQVLCEKDRLHLQKYADQEYIFLLMLVLKNEARGNRRGYMGNIRKVCLDHETRRLIRNTPVQVSEKSNRLLYMAMKHPNIMNLLLLRLAMVVYYKGHGKQA